MNVRNDITGHGLTEDEERVKPEYFQPEGKKTLNIYPGGTSSFLFDHPTGDGTAYDDIRIQVDEQGGTVQIESSGLNTYDDILRIKSYLRLAHLMMNCFEQIKCLLFRKVPVKRSVM